MLTVFGVNNTLHLVKTRAVVFEQPQQLSVRELTLVPATDADVLVAMRWSGISTGTERMLWTGTMPPFPGLGYPLVPGYEGVGEIVEAGSESGRTVGDLVYIAGSRGFTDARGLFGGHSGLIRLHTGLAVDVVGLGASAPSYYPAVGEKLGCKMILPEHAGVANAIGAVVGRVTMRRMGTVTAPAEGRFRVHLDTGPEDFTTAESAMARLEAILSEAALGAARAAGAEDIRLTTARDIRRAMAENREVFLEATVTIEASGRPRIAD